MKNYRTEIITALLISLVIIGAIAFFLSRLKEKQQKRMDLYDLILPEVEQVLLINKPALFSEILEGQPHLSHYFNSLIPGVYWELLPHLNRTPVLLAYYPRGIVMYYHVQQERDEVSAYFQETNFVPVRKRKIRLQFYPKASTPYLGKYMYKDVSVVSDSRKLLETIADNHQDEKATCPSALKQLSEQVDGGALLNALFQPEATTGWQAIDLFLHEKQICALYNQPLNNKSDSLIAATADSLTIWIEKTIPGLKVQSGLSTDNTAVYYTFCTTLLPVSNSPTSSKTNN